MEKPPFLICNQGINRKIIKIRFIFLVFLFVIKRLKNTLKKTEIEISEEGYLASLIFSNLIYFILSLGLFTLIFYFARELSLNKSLLISLAVSFGIMMMLSLFFILYPGILARKKGENIERNLVFVLKDLLMQLESGSDMQRAFFSISKSNYGETSKEFSKVVKEINKGVSVEDSLRNLSERIESDYLKKTIWQITNAMHAGTSFKTALRNIINDLILEQRSKIKNYSQELNVWSLVYMMVAVALPTIGITIMIILSTFAGFGISQDMLIMFLIIAFIVQFLIVGMVKSRRPLVDF